MTYILRNTIILATLLVIILVIGFYFRFGVLPKKIDNADKEIKTIDVELQNTPDLINTYNQYSQLLVVTKQKWEGRNKDIPPVDVTGQTYDYFNRTIDKSGEVKLDMLYQGIRNYKNYGFNTYNLKGEAPFENLYKFIWYIENSRLLYKIRNINLKGIELKEKESGETKLMVTYEITLEAYFSSIPELYSSSGERKLVAAALVSNPFEPLILRDLPANTEDLLEIERSDLKAVVPGKAFVVDQNNKMRTLSEGDEVYLGYVTKIDPVLGRIECTLNKGGIIEKIELYIRYGQKQK